MSTETPPARQPQYAEVSYWDARYKAQPLSFEWFYGWTALRKLLRQALPKGKKVLQVGCGNSNLQEGMVQAGYHVVNLDISQVVIDQMRALHAHLGQACEYVVGDCRDMSMFNDCQFYGAIDKGTIDALLCSKSATENIRRMCSEICRVLQPGSTFVAISLGDPSSRLHHLRRPEFDWSVQVVLLPRVPAHEMVQAPDRPIPVNDTLEPVRFLGPFETKDDLSIEGLPQPFDPSGYFYAYLCRKAPLKLLVDSKRKGSLPHMCAAETREAMERLQQELGLSKDVLTKGKRTRKVKMSEFLAAQEAAGDGLRSSFYGFRNSGSQVQLAAPTSPAPPSPASASGRSSTALPTASALALASASHPGCMPTTSTSLTTSTSPPSNTAQASTAGAQAAGAAPPVVLIDSNRASKVHLSPRQQINEGRTPVGAHSSPLPDRSSLESEAGTLPSNSSLPTSPGRANTTQTGAVHEAGVKPAAGSSLAGGEVERRSGAGASAGRGSHHLAPSSAASHTLVSRSISSLEDPLDTQGLFNHMGVNSPIGGTTTPSSSVLAESPGAGNSPGPSTAGGVGRSGTAAALAAAAVAAGAWHASTATLTAGGLSNSGAHPAGVEAGLVGQHPQQPLTLVAQPVATSAQASIPLQPWYGSATKVSTSGTAAAAAVHRPSAAGAAAVPTVVPAAVPPALPPERNAGATGGPLTTPTAQSPAQTTEQVSHAMSDRRLVSSDVSLASATPVALEPAAVLPAQAAEEQGITGDTTHSNATSVLEEHNLVRSKEEDRQTAVAAQRAMWTHQSQVDEAHAAHRKSLGMAPPEAAAFAQPIGERASA